MLGVCQAILGLAIIFAILGAPVGALVPGVFVVLVELALFIRAGMR